MIHSETLDNRHVERDVRVETMAARAAQWTQLTPRLGNEFPDLIRTEEPLRSGWVSRLRYGQIDNLINRTWD